MGHWASIDCQSCLRNWQLSLWKWVVESFWFLRVPPRDKRMLDSTDMNLGNLQEMVRDREAWHAAVYADAKSRTRLGDWTTNNPLVKQCHPTQSHRPQHHSKMSMLFSQVSLADHTCMISALWPLGQTVCLTQCTSSQCNLQLRIWKQLAQHLW